MLCSKSMLFLSISCRPAFLDDARSLGRLDECLMFPVRIIVDKTAHYRGSVTCDLFP